MARQAPKTRARILDDDLAEVLDCEDCKMTELRSFMKEYLEEEELVEKVDGKSVVHLDARLKSALGTSKSKVSGKEFWFTILPKALKTRVEYYTP